MIRSMTIIDKDDCVVIVIHLNALQQIGLALPECPVQLIR
jgi:hypothetical protein